MSRPAMIAPDPERWRRDALAHICAVALETGRVHADDLRKMPEQPEHHNAIGAVFREASRRGFLEAAGFRRSRAKSRNGGAGLEWAPTPSLRAAGLRALDAPKEARP